MAELRELADRVASARRGLAHGDTTRVIGIEHDIDVVCRAILNLPYGDAMAVRPALKALQADLTALFAEMEGQSDKPSVAEGPDDVFLTDLPPDRTVH